MHLHRRRHDEQIADGLHEHTRLGHHEPDAHNDLVQPVPHVEVLVIVVFPQEQPIVERDPRAVNLRRGVSRGGGGRRVVIAVAVVVVLLRVPLAAVQQNTCTARLTRAREVLCANCTET